LISGFTDGGQRLRGVGFVERYRGRSKIDVFDLRAIDALDRFTDSIHAFLAVHAFNRQRYPNALHYCRASTRLKGKVIFLD
jgi:hypothetical protein